MRTKSTLPVPTPPRMPDLHATTDLLLAARGGQGDDARRLFEAVYDQLRELAAAWLSREPERARSHTLQPTALVHEAYLKMIDQQRAAWNDRAHFLAVASEAIRRILVDHARKRQAQKRGGGWGDAGWSRLTIDEAGLLNGRQPPDLLALDEALSRLASLHGRQADVVRMKFFGGLSGDEIAEALAIDRATVVRDWTAARAWLLAELAEAEP